MYLINKISAPFYLKNILLFRLSLIKFLMYLRYSSELIKYFISLRLSKPKEKVSIPLQKQSVSMHFIL
jgi:hypothetical protein